MANHKSSDEERYQDGNFASRREFYKKNLKPFIPIFVQKIHYKKNEIVETLYAIGKEIEKINQTQTTTFQKLPTAILSSHPDDFKSIFYLVAQGYESSLIDYFYKKLWFMNIRTRMDLRKSKHYETWKNFNPDLRNDIKRDYQFKCIMRNLVKELENHE